MTYVSTTQFADNGDYVTVPWSVGSLVAGDVLLAVIYGNSAYALNGRYPSIPQQSDTSAPGWTPLGMWTQPSGAFPVAVWWQKVAASGTSSGTIAPVNRNVAAITGPLLDIMVFRSQRLVFGVSSAIVNAQSYAWPSVGFGGKTKSGHVIYIAGSSKHGTAGVDSYPSFPASGSTVRDTMTRSGSSTLGSATISERTFTTVYGSPTATSGYGSGNAIAIAIVDSSGPDAPAVTSPAPGSNDLAAGFTIAWTPNGVQTKYAIRRRTPSGTGSWTWWNGTNWTSATTETLITSTAMSLVVPAAAFANSATTYDLAVATVGDATNPDTGAYAQIALTGIAAPTTSSVTVTPLTGSTLTSRVPTVTVAGSVGSGGTFTRFDVQVLVGGSVVASGSHASGGSWTVPVANAITNGASVTVQGRTVQNGTQASAWTSAGPYTVTVTAPAAPTVTVTQVTNPTSGLPGLRVTVASAAGTVVLARTGSTTIGTFTSTGTLIVDDYLAPTDIPATYTATVTDAAVPPNTSPVGTGTGTLSAPETAEWLFDPLTPESAVSVQVQEMGTVTHGTRATAYQPLNSPAWVIRSLGGVDGSGAAKVAVSNPGDVDAAVGMLSSGRRLGLRLPSEWDGNGGLYPQDLLFFRVSGDVTEDRMQQLPVSWRVLSFAYVTQD